jgi:hypothetical protein
MSRDGKMPELPSEEREVYEHTYRARRLLLGDWIELETLVMSLIGSQVLDLDENNLSSLAPAAIRSSNPQAHRKLFELLGKSIDVQKDGGGWSPLTYERQSRWWAFYQRELPAAVALFFEVQFRDFFSGLELLSGDKGEPLEGADQEEAQLPSLFQNTSAGRS